VEISQASNPLRLRLGEEKKEEEEEEEEEEGERTNHRMKI